MKKAIVIGSGAGGATAAKELQNHYAVTILEAGNEFSPFSGNLNFLSKLRKTGLLFDEREIQLLFPAMKIRKSRPGKMVLVNGLATGGTTTIATGNAIRCDQDLQDIGIDLSIEFAELAQEIPISTAHETRWRPATRKLFGICQEMGLQPGVTPKMGNYERCTGCGRCVLGCRNDVKWDSRHFIREAVRKGAKLVTGCSAEKILIQQGHAVGVYAHKQRKLTFFPADLIIIAAGGFATPIILQNSGIPCKSTLFVDPVLCVAARWPDALQNKEIPMPFVVQQSHFILAPYFDYLCYFFNKSWRIPAQHLISLMIKLADCSNGTVNERGIEKTLTKVDNDILMRGVETCREILAHLGVQKNDMFLGTLNAGHPGGMLPLTEKEAVSLHSSALPDNVYVADATLFPKSLGNPPILTIMALAKRISRQL